MSASPGGDDTDADPDVDADSSSDDEPRGVAGGAQKRSNGRLSFRLPPFRLPEFFPPDFELRFPIPGIARKRRVSARTVLVACLAFDLFDAVVAILVTSPLVGGARAFGGLVLAASVVDAVGLVYSWELLAVLLGYPELTAFPSLTVLLFLRARG